MNHPMTIKSLLVLLAILIGIVVGLVAGGLARTSGASLTAAIRDSGIAFGGAVTLVILIFNSLGLL
jgi:predicted branched-subunit amino acid permease